MKGEQLKRKIVLSGHSITETSKMLGVSQQSLSQSLQVQDVKTGLIEKLSQVLALPISYFFGDEDLPKGAVANGDFSAASIHGNATVNASNENEILKERIKSLEALLDEKERTIQLFIAQNQRSPTR